MKKDISPAIRDHPTKIILETTTRCNLECGMCMKNTCEETFSESDFNPHLFEKLTPSLSRAESLVLNGIGEPLLVPELENYIVTAKETMPEASWVGFQTNGLLLNRERAYSLSASGLDKILVSIDSPDPDGYGRIRSGGDFHRIVSAITNLHAAKTKVKSSLVIGIEVVVRKDNLEHLPDIIRFTGEKGVNYALVSHLFPYHPDMANLACYDSNHDKSVEILFKYLKATENEGIDLRDYKRSLTHYSKTEKDLRITEFLNGMTTEAHEQGSTLNLNTLLSRDHSLSKKTREIFDEALAVAKTYGMELALPGTIPKSSRRCEFVEGGSAFISAEGFVHPCYFLWHSYRCYFNGLHKAVGSRTFGNVADFNLQDIWNGNEFEQFRKNVTQYEYPYCFNCNFALCDYMQVEDFEQDCYISTEPCGACLWCMDIFQCMF